MADTANFPVPPANFEFLVESILMQAQMQLGLFKMDEDSEPNLPLARHSIDLLAMLQEKTRNNLSVEESRLLDNGLTELRFRYVQVSGEMKSGLHTTGTTPPDASDDTPRIITADGGKGTKSF